MAAISGSLVAAMPAKAMVVTMVVASLVAAMAANSRMPASWTWWQPLELVLRLVLRPRLRLVLRPRVRVAIAYSLRLSNGLVRLAFAYPLANTLATSRMCTCNRGSALSQCVAAFAAMGMTCTWWDMSPIHVGTLAPVSRKGCPSFVGCTLSKKLQRMRYPPTL